MNPGTRVNRNDPCPCGSGKKYKKCCLGKASSPATAPTAPAPKADPRRLLQTAQEHHQAGRLDEAHDFYRRVLAAVPKAAPALYGLSMIRAQLGFDDEAVQLAGQAVEIEPKLAEYQAHLANLLLRSGRMEEALESATRALLLDPGLVAAHHIVGICHARMHRLAEARVAYEKLLSIDPEHALGHLELAVLGRRHGQPDEARQRLQRLLAGPLPPELRTRAFKELGLALDKLGEYEAAFDALEQAGAPGAETIAVQRADREAWRRHVDECRTDFTREIVTRWTRDTFQDERPPPSFLVGFPRSGTTLTEQILAAHPAIVTCDEKPMVLAVKEQLAGMFEGDQSDAAMLGQLDRDDVVKLRARYWREAESVVDNELAGKVFVDKLPLNIVDVGLINTIFPEGRLIVALRDPRDVCLSCFMQPFELNELMLNFLWWERTAEFYAGVMGLWLHQREMITLPFAEVRYEDTVNDLEGQARRILGLLGLEWDERITTFHEQAQQRYISTPSYSAVREPVHRRAMERWRNYEARYDRVSTTLEPFIKAFGYG